MAVSRSSSVPADPTKWSEKSQQSVTFGWTTHYIDLEYQCWSCGKPSVFTAQDQQYTYEILKAPIDQRRVLCSECWKNSIEIAEKLKHCETRWAAEKSALKTDTAFISQWLELLKRQEHYRRYKQDTARKNMLLKLLHV